MDEVFFLEHNTSVNRFVKLTYKTLASTGFVPLQRLEFAYRSMESIIHQGLENQNPDVTVLKYVCSRLPMSIFRIEHVLIGQSESFFKESGVDIDSCREVFAKARRRRYMFDGKSTLLVFIASKSDLDDVIPSLIALQIEWNKCYMLLQGVELDHMDTEKLAAQLHLQTTDMEKLICLFGPTLFETMKTMQSRTCDFRIKNFEASYCRYRKETEIWWNHIQEKFPAIEAKAIYFISSNTHSLINLISGFAESIEQEILEYARNNVELSTYIEAHRSLSDESRDNLLYYLLMQYEQDSQKGASVKRRRIAWEEEMGISRIASNETLDVPTQIIDIKRLAQKSPNERFKKAFSNSEALILNIDYPLGRTSYFILNKIAEHVSRILGIYVIGKAASLFANRGDVLIPSSISDQHTKNQYFFTNAIEAKDVLPFLEDAHNGIYDNQKAVTVLGTMLQNKEMLDAFLLAGITDLEMEAGPYLAAIYEITRPKRYPEKERIFLFAKNFDIGIIHYVSDNPLSTQKLDTSLSIHGVDATYACTRAVLEKVLAKEQTNNG